MTDYVRTRPTGCICASGPSGFLECVADNHSKLVPYRRASHKTVCEGCGKLYLGHPMDREILSYQGEPFLHVLCSGERVKL